LSKYGARKTTVNGITFASKGEANRDAELVMLEMAGEIFGLVRQPKFEIVPAFVYRGKKHAATHYIADWMYEEDGETVIEDFKGVETPVFKLKWKLMKMTYRQYVYRISK